ncbi:MAG: hypothetical protein K2X77_01525 [Candidatus Obscuribacterales bacterium]|jgi:tetratricopeptide (TPR) repeat protein|nr:hypothetical protein [Candidatus Obscuribacterales bacterium]
MAAEKSSFESAQEHFDKGNFSECLRLLVFALTASPDDLKCYQLASACLQKIGAPDESALFERAISNFEDPDAFYDLGYHFIDVGHDRLAVPLLERALKLRPGDANIALELAIAYCGQFYPQKGRAVLSTVGRGQNFWVNYQYYWSSLLCGVDENTDRFIKESRRQFLAEAASNEIRGALYALDKLDELRLRLSLITEPKPIVMHWHFIQYGSAILEYFDDRNGQNGLAVAGGRWVYVGISYAQLALTLRKLKTFLATLNRMPKTLLTVDDRDSMIIAAAVGKILRAPVEIISEPNTASREESLLVVANNWNLGKLPIERVAKGQTIFAFNINWLEEGPCAPDVCGLMSQYCTFPWSKDRLEIDPETKQRREAVEDKRDPEEIASEIAAEVVAEDELFPQTMEFYKSVGDYLKGGKLGGQKRWRFITDSPVPGSYFC